MIVLVGKKAARKHCSRHITIRTCTSTAVEFSCAFMDFEQDFSSTDGYIATQAPLPATMADFWEMVFEQRSGVIVMLADLVEDGRVSSPL